MSMCAGELKVRMGYTNRFDLLGSLLARGFLGLGVTKMDRMGRIGWLVGW